MRTILFANAAPGVRCLALLADRFGTDSVLVVAADDGHPWHDSVLDAAADLGVKAIAPARVNDPAVVEQLGRFGADWMVSASYTKLLGAQLLDLVTHAVNLHPSLLPKYRGTAPVIWAIVHGETTTGVTAHQMTATVDRGTVYGRVEVPIGSDDTGYDLHHRTAAAAAELLGTLADSLDKDGALNGAPMAEGGSYFSSKTPRVNELDPANQTRTQVRNIVRALASPLPNAYVQTAAGRLLVNRVEPVDGPEGESVWYLHAVDGWLQVTDGALMEPS